MSCWTRKEYGIILVMGERKGNKGKFRDDPVKKDDKQREIKTLHGFSFS